VLVFGGVHVVAEGVGGGPEFCLQTVHGGGGRWGGEWGGGIGHQCLRSNIRSFEGSITAASS
jgi:hypothetical protein